MSAGEPPYDEALRAVVAVLAALRSRAMLIGGLAVIVHGHIRTTDDIDATVSGVEVAPERILEVAAAHDVVPRIAEAVAFAKRTQVLLLVHRPTGVPLDLSLAWLPFEEEALDRRMVVRFRGMELRVCDPEDLVVYKLIAARPHDLEDARQTTMRHWRRIDRERVRRTLAVFDEMLEDGRSRVALWRRIEQSSLPRT